MQYRTAQQRLEAIVEAYHKIVNRPCTTKEIAEWSLANELYPVPKRGDPPAACEAWEARLEAAIRRAT